METQIKILPDGLSDVDHLARTSDPLPLPAEGLIYGTLIENGESAKEKEVNPFSKNEKLQRTPQSSPRPARRNNQVGEVANRKDLPRKEDEAIRKEATVVHQKKEIAMGTSQEDAGGSLQKEAGNGQTKGKKAGEMEGKLDLEEKELQKCIVIINKMKAATDKQKNVSMDIKNGLLHLKDSVEVLLLQRKRRLEAKAEGRREEMEVNVEVESNPKKRLRSSPGSTSKSRRAKASGSNGGESKTGETPRNFPRTREIPPREALNATFEKSSDGGSDAGSWKRPGRYKKPRGAETLRDTPKSRGRSKRRVKSRPEALRIRPAQGKTYAEVLGEIRKKVNPEDTQTEIKAIRKTRSGDMLVEFGASTKDKNAFSEEIKGILGNDAEVQALEPYRISLEIRDLDCFTEAEEIEEALRKAVPEPGEIKINITPEDPRGLRVAIVSMEQTAASKIIRVGKIKVGWVVCRIRRRAVVKRCYKCLGYGHMAFKCNGPDRKDLCYKCGSSGHKVKECTGVAHCMLCSHKGLERNLDHVPGTGKCTVFREALQKEKSRIK